MPTIRNARRDEAETLASIGIRSWETAVAGWMNIEGVKQNAADAFMNFTRNHFLSIDVIEKAGDIAGWSARENLDNKITDLWVDPLWQKQGMGRLLLEKLEREILDQGYENVEIETHSQNSLAIGFLQHMGFRIKWMTARWSPQIDREVDTIGMVKSLLPAETPDMAYQQF